MLATMDDFHPQSERTLATSRLLAFFDVALIWAVFYLHAGWAAPEVNEPHYLGKARHYWNPTWCAGDFFLESKDAHQLFYWSVGWLANVLPFPAAAWVGRIAAWLLLAWAWRRLSYAIVPRPLAAPLAAGLMIAMLSWLNLAGEWIVGGIEAKCLSYVFVLLGLEALVRERWNRVWLLLGAATALHVLVGGWSLLAAGVAWLLAGRDRPSIVRMLPALAGGAALSLIGLAPALALSGPASPEVVNEANQIYVFDRLPHHLAPFRSDRWPLLAARSVGLLAAFLLLARIVSPDPGIRRLRNFVLASVLFALCGIAIGYSCAANPPLAARLLRFYWFRLYDVALPIGTAILAVYGLMSIRVTRPVAFAAALLAAIVLAGSHLAFMTRQRALVHCAPADLKVINRETGDAADWIEMCRWVAEHTPTDARFLTPREGQTFKWYAERAEVLTQKDIPQDAEAIVEWARRRDDVFPLREGLQGLVRISLQRRTDQELAVLGRKYQASYLVAATSRPLAFPLVFQNNSFAVYRLTPQPYDYEAGVRAPDREDSEP